MKILKSTIAVIMSVLIITLPQMLCLAAEWTPNLVCEDFTVSRQKIYAGDTFTLSFDLKNTSSKLDVRNVLVRISGGEAFSINNSADTVYKESVGKSSSVTVSKSFYCNENAVKGVYPVSVSASYEYEKNGEALSESRDFSINLKVEEKKNNEASQQQLTPQVLITGFSFGGSQVEGGSEFNLSFTAKNNSDKIDIRNVVIKLIGGEAFVVADGTDTLSVDRIKANSTATFNKSFKCLNSTPSGVQSVAAVISYEYFEGASKASGSSELTMSIPVIQQDKLSFEALELADQKVTVNQESDCPFKLINRGQTKLGSATVSVSDESGNVLASAFIGTVEAGTQFESNYTLPVTITKEGTHSLTITVEYENENLEGKAYSQTFKITAEEYKDPYENITGNDNSHIEEADSTPKIIAIAVTVIALLVIIIAVPKIIKKKKQRKGSESFDEEI